MTRLLIANLALLAMSAAANATILDFEKLDAGTITANEYVALELSIGVANLSVGPELVALLESHRSTGGDTGLAPVIGYASPGNLLILREQRSCEGSVCASSDEAAAGPSGQFIIGFFEDALTESVESFDFDGEEASPGYAAELNFLSQPSRE